ncbi:MAG TPA: hypothetical protein VFV31_08345 [Chitinophagaceae bacterium]|nr:hypothetical protein [Chitinophagaceae bacterium]
MKRYLIAVIVCCQLIPLMTAAQTLLQPLQSPYTGLMAYSTQQSEIFSVTGNPASLARLKIIAAGISAERRFLLNELNAYQAVAGLPTASGNFGIVTNYSGFSSYNETKMGLVYARSLGKKIDIGAQFNYHGISIAGYGNASTVSAEAGAIMHLADNLHAGLRVTNPVGGKFGKDNEKLPFIYSAGVGYDASDRFFIAAEIVKEENKPVTINAGFQYRLPALLHFRAGVSSATSQVWGGAGIRLPSFRIDLISSYHPQLGLTPGLLILFGKTERKNE